MNNLPHEVQVRVLVLGEDTKSLDDVPGAVSGLSEGGLSHKVCADCRSVVFDNARVHPVAHVVAGNIYIPAHDLANVEEASKPSREIKESLGWRRAGGDGGEAVAVGSLRPLDTLAVDGLSHIVERHGCVTLTERLSRASHGGGSKQGSNSHRLGDY